MNGAFVDLSVPVAGGKQSLRPGVDPQPQGAALQIEGTEGDCAAKQENEKQDRSRAGLDPVGDSIEHLGYRSRPKRLA